MAQSRSLGYRKENYIVIQKGAREVGRAQRKVVVTALR